MEKYHNAVDAALLTVGLSYSLDNIQTALGVIILVLQIVWILFKFGYYIYRGIKGGSSPNDIENEVEQIIEELVDLKHKHDEQEEDDEHEDRTE